MIRTWVLVVLSVVAQSVARPACPNNTQTTVVFGNGMLTAHDDAKSDLDNVLAPAVLRALGPTIESSCITFWPAFDSLFLDTNNKLLNYSNLAPQIIDAAVQIGIDFAANFWDYWNFRREPPPQIQNLQRTMLTAATSVFQPDLIKHEVFYNAELGLGHNIIVVAHSQGNLYVNQAYNVVTSLGGKDLFHVVAVATPARAVAGGGPYFTLNGDVITLLALPPLSLASPPNIRNDPPSPCLIAWFSIACHSFADSYMSELKGSHTRPAIEKAVVSNIRVGGQLPSSFLSFTQGDPFGPGDGMVISRSPTEVFNLVTPISLASMRGGLTVTVFTSLPASQVSSGLVIRAFKNSSCQRTFTAGEGNPTSVRLNGVEGVSNNWSTSLLDGSVVANANRVMPGCDFAMDDLSITGLILQTTPPSQPITSLDAVAILPGENNTPGSTLPSPLISYYTDRTTWAAAIPGATTITFEGSAPNGGTGGFDTSAGLFLSGVRFVGSAPSNTTLPFYLRVVDPAFNSLYNWNSGALLQGPPIPLGPQGEGGLNSHIRVILPTGTTAVAADIMSILEHASSFTVVISTVNQPRAIQTSFSSQSHPSRRFFGFKSATPITSMEFYANKGFPMIDNFSFAQ